jgi:hypothetical protein
VLERVRERERERERREREGEKERDTNHLNEVIESGKRFPPLAYRAILKASKKRLI